MAITIRKLTPYTGEVAIPGQQPAVFSANMQNQLTYEKNLALEVNDTVDDINQSALEIEQNAITAEQAATSAEASVSLSGYAGLWPDSGGSASIGDTYQTQSGGTPTGEYFTALKSTTVTPIDDNINWKQVLSSKSIEVQTLDLMNDYGISGKAKTPQEVGLTSGDLNAITEENYHSLTLTGSWDNSPFGDASLMTGVLSIYRRKFDAGAAVVQELHHQDGNVYRRVGAGVPIVFSPWKKILNSDDLTQINSDISQVDSDLSQLSLDLEPKTAKAWVNFNGTGTVAIRDSYNIGAVIDVGTGVYNPVFSNQLPNSNYAVLTGGTRSFSAGDVEYKTSSYNYSVSGFYLKCYSSTTSLSDHELVTACVFSN